MRLNRLPFIIWASTLVTLPLAPRAAPQNREQKLPAARIAGISVAGLTPRQARLKLEQALQPKLAVVIRLTDGKKSVARKRNDLGFVLDVDGMVGEAKSGHKAVGLRLKVNRNRFLVVLRRLEWGFTTPGKNAVPIYQHGKVRIAPGRDERTVDVGLSAQALAGLAEKKPQVSVLQLVMVRRAPPISAAALKGIDARLSEFVTQFNPGSTKRVHNIRVAVGRINSSLVRPGQVFSFNQTVKERTHENGYLTATVLEKNKPADGIGGGVSQVSGTLFNAALLAGLKIVEYMPHSRPVAYLPVGRDATVVWGVRDLKIKNTTQHPIYVAYSVEGNRCRAAIFGSHQAVQTVRLDVQKKKPGPTHVITDLYRIVTKGGKQTAKEKIGHADYDWKPEPQQD